MFVHVYLHLQIHAYLHNSIKKKKTEKSPDIYHLKNVEDIKQRD